MEHKMPQDRINRELSEVFFGKKKMSTPQNDAPSVAPNMPPLKKDLMPRNISVIRNMSILAAVALLVFLALPHFTGKEQLQKQKAAAPEEKVTPPGRSVPAAGDSSPIQKISLTKKEMNVHSQDTVPLKNTTDLRTLYDFETGTSGWEIPSWETDNPDYAAVSLEYVNGFSSSGKGCIELTAKFPGYIWKGALSEIQQYLDLKGYDLIAADIYLPENAPKWIRGKIILTTGKDWTFTEMTRGTRLEPGKWTTVKADLTDKSNDWKRTVITENMKSDVRKIAIRIESDKYPYYGPVYIDNIRVCKETGN